jgi:hypothetical protein
MAALTVTNGTLFARQLLQDSNTSFPAATDAEYLRAFNDRYMMFYKLVEKRVQLITAVTSVSTTTHLNTSDAGFVAPEIESALLDYQTGYDTPLERMKWNDLQAVIDQDHVAGGGGGGASTGTPYLYAAAKLHGSSEKWSFLIYPLNNAAAVLKCYARVYPTALASGSDVPELGDAEGYWLYRMGAADIAAIIGRPELVETILAPIPEWIRGKMGVERKREDPKRRPEASVLS